MNQTTVSTFSISFGIKHLLQFIFLLFGAYSYEGRGEALQSSTQRLRALTKQSNRWLKHDEDGEGRVAKGSTYLDAGLDPFWPPEGLATTAEARP